MLWALGFCSNRGMKMELKRIELMKFQYAVIVSLVPTYEVCCMFPLGHNCRLADVLSLKG